MDIKIVFHPSGDWEGLYIDGVLGPEGHSISIDEFVDALNKANYGRTQVEDLEYSTRDLGNEEGFDVEDFSFPLKYEDIDGSNKM
jgi:hypothetical protein